MFTDIFPRLAADSVLEASSSSECVRWGRGWWLGPESSKCASAAVDMILNCPRERPNPPLNGSGGPAWDRLSCELSIYRLLVVVLPCVVVRLVVVVDWVVQSSMLLGVQCGSEGWLGGWSWA